MCASTRIFKTCIFVVPRVLHHKRRFSTLMVSWKNANKNFQLKNVCVCITNFELFFTEKVFFHFTIAYCVWRKPLFKCQCKFWFDSQMSLRTHLLKCDFGFKICVQGRWKVHNSEGASTKRRWGAWAFRQIIFWEL